MDTDIPANTILLWSGGVKVFCMGVAMSVLVVRWSVTTHDAGSEVSPGATAEKGDLRSVGCGSVGDRPQHGGSV